MEFKIDTTLERDIDLLIIEEFASSPAFAEIFLTAADITGEYVIERAIHSKTDVEFGESDIVFILNLGGRRHALHIENKIDAMAMQNQNARYHSRGEKDKAAGEYDDFSVLIVAPERYLQVNREAQKYDYRVTYEQLQDFFASQDSPRAKYKLALIERSIINQKNGYQYEANPGMVRFCKAMNDYHKVRYPGLPAGSIAWWRNYPTPMNDVAVVFKANKGFCDLQFGHTTKEALFPQVCEFLTDRMNVVSAGKSAAIRIEVTPIWYENDFGEEKAKVDQALDAINELFQLSKRIASKKYASNGSGNIRA